MAVSDFIPEERISFKEVIDRIWALVHHVLGLWKKIVIISLILSAIYIAYELISDPTYTAETTFVLEGNSQSQMAQVSSLASSLGFNLGSLGGEEGLFQSDNIIQLYTSRKMLYETFLSKESINEQNVRLITRLAEFQEWDEKWRRKIDSGFSFEEVSLTVQHDSVLFEVIKKFREKNLIVEKPDRKLSILSVRVNHKDQLFAKRFNEVLVERVNQFYLETTTKKSGDNLAIIQKQADSAKMLLDQSLDELALVTESTPNPNPVFKSSQAAIQKARVEVETNAAVYAELVKSLEIARVTHLNNMPLIQIIDEPLLPLEDDKDTILKTIFKGGIYAGLIVVIFFVLQYIFQQAIKAE